LELEMSDDPLSDLLLDADEIDRTLLANSLKNLLGIDNKSGRVVPKPGFNSLSARNKVLAFVLAKKAAQLLGVLESELANPKQISEESGIPDGTVRPKLRELIEGKLLSQADGGDYYVAQHQLSRVISELTAKEGDNE
jgi:hypothetical protein